MANTDIFVCYDQSILTTRKVLSCCLTQLFVLENMYNSYLAPIYSFSRKSLFSEYIILKLWSPPPPPPPCPTPILPHPTLYHPHPPHTTLPHPPVQKKGPGLDLLENISAEIRQNSYCKSGHLLVKSCEKGRVYYTVKIGIKFF